MWTIIVTRQEGKNYIQAKEKTRTRLERNSKILQQLKIRVYPKIWM